MSSRVIAGKAKGRRLKLVPGEGTRPIMDRVKESLFNIISGDVKDSVWLDMFAGTGAVGIEALSRGASEVVFLDKARLAITTINDNLNSTGLADNAYVMRTDSIAYLDRSPSRTFDVIYIAPPQYKGMWKDALKKVDQRVAWLNPDAMVIVQIDPKEVENITLENLEAYDERAYGRTTLLFYEFPGE